MSSCLRYASGHTYRQTDIHTDTLIAIFHTLIVVGSNKYYINSRLNWNEKSASKDSRGAI